MTRDSKPSPIKVDRINGIGIEVMHRRRLPRTKCPSRGVTLVEMLVVVALLVLMMTIIVSIFGAATGAVSASKVYQELDDELRQIEGTIRQDLTGVTARLNPPLDPSENLGYFEYSENAFADPQGEDTDDTLRFTAKAPAGQPFTGRFYVPRDTTGWTPQQLLLYQSTQPITITSQYAEIIYFLRRGNLYRRVLLIAPELQPIVNQAGTTTAFFTGMLGGYSPVSWPGVNDISARPSASGPAGPPILNTLGDLTNRENRAFSPRFCNDFDRNGIPDDYNQDAMNNTVGDGVPDYYPTLYPNAFNRIPSLLNVSGYTPTSGLSASNQYQIYAFPFIFPGAYSQPEPDPGTTANPTYFLGWVHSLDPTGNTFNHAPLDLGDSLTTPSSTSTIQYQTWWGFPTWRETMCGPTPTSPGWRDPVWQVNDNVGGSPVQALGLQPYNPTTIPTKTGITPPPFPTGQNLLPELGGRTLFSDPVAGTNSAFNRVYVIPVAGSPPERRIWEDDLLMTGVRSFDVKGFDPGFSNYIDLGYPGNYILGFTGATTPAQATGPLQTLQHEGRIPPIGAADNSTPNDFRFDPKAQEKGLFFNLGDNSAGVIRLRRVWDTWSTAYTEAPSDGYNPSTPDLEPYGLAQLQQPVYPSYPPPYEAPLRGIQIQIRVVDPRNERSKVMTIRHDFSDKIFKRR